MKRSQAIMQNHDALVTIVIPTYCRPDYLERSIAYYKKYKISIVIVDSSDQPFIGSLASDISYFHLPGMNFLEKVNFAIQKVQTPYVNLCADDDFIKIKSLDIGVSFLEENNNYSTYVGMYLGIIAPENNEFRQIYNLLKARKIDGSIKTKVDLLSKDYYQILWSLNRTSIISKVFSSLATISLKNDNFIELYFAVNILLSGNLIISDDVWGCRTVEKESWGRRHSAIDSLSYLQQEDFLSLKKLFVTKIGKKMFHRFIKKYIKSSSRTKIKSLINKIKNLFSINIHIRNWKRDSAFEKEILDTIKEVSYKKEIK